MTAADATSRPGLLMTGAYPAWDMPLLEAQYEVHKLWEAKDPAALIAMVAPSVRALATRGDLGASAALIAALPKLEIIGVFGVGYDSVDLASCRERGIAVTNTPDVLTGDVADLAVGLALALSRKIPAGDQLVRAGTWPQAGLPLVDRFYGKKVGIAGFGRIGQMVAKRLAGFEVEIGYFSRKPVDGSPYQFIGALDALANWSDYLIVTLAGGAETKGLIGTRVLAALGPKGYLVNVSRGSTVDEAALLKALEEKTIAGAGLDVFLNEPNIDPRFFTLENTVLQPHHGSGTFETRKAMGQLVRDNLAAHFAGKPLLTPVI